MNMAGGGYGIAVKSALIMLIALLLVVEKAAAADTCKENMFDCADDSECCSGNCDFSDRFERDQCDCVPPSFVCKTTEQCCEGLTCIQKKDKSYACEKVASPPPATPSPAISCKENMFDCADDSECCSGNCDFSDRFERDQCDCVPPSFVCKTTEQCCEGLTCIQKKDKSYACEKVASSSSSS